MDDHNTQRMGSTLNFLTRYPQEGDEFLDSIVRGDETWVLHQTLNPSNSNYNGPIRIPPEPKNSNLQFQCKRSWRPFCGTEKAFSWLTSCLLAQQLMPLHIVIS